jgi:nitrate reductase gamma subunit
MTLTLLLAKVFGIALIAVSIALLTKREFFAKITRDFLQQDLLRLVISFLELLAGLFIVIGHNRWSPLPAAVITVLGWVFVLEGASYLLLPEKYTARFINAVNRPHFFVASGVIGLILGIYLADYGFALWPRFQ